MSKTTAVLSLALLSSLSLACGAPAETPTAASQETRALGVTLEGQLCNLHTARFVSGALVDVRDEADTLTSTVADEAGAFAIDGLASGVLIVTYRSPTYQRTEVIEAAAGDVIVVETAEGCAQ